MWCLRNSYFQEKEQNFSQSDGLPMGSCLSLTGEWHFDSFFIWQYSDRPMQDFLNPLLNALKSPQWTRKSKGISECENRKNKTSVSRKPTDRQYLDNQFNQPLTKKTNKDTLGSSRKNCNAPYALTGLTRNDQFKDSQRKSEDRTSLQSQDSPQALTYL